MINSEFITNERDVFFKIAERYINKSSRILDIGAGDASFAKTLNRNDIYLLDGNAETIKILQEKYENVYHGYLPELPFEDNYFDLIHCSHIVEHLEPQILWELLVNIDKKLKNNGFVIISAPLFWSGFFNDMSHVKPYNPYIFKKYMTSNKQSSLTKLQVSDKYMVIEEVARYTKQKIGSSKLFYHKFKVIQLMISFAVKAINTLGFRRLERSGFTLVLQKLEDRVK